MIKILKNIGYLATCRDEGHQSEIHPVMDAALAWEYNEHSSDKRKSKILWTGPEKNLPFNPNQSEIYDAGKKLVVPGLIDCHTHLGFGGWRSNEFTDRILGKSYLEIAKRGGGILSTVKHTRDSSFDELLEKSKKFLDEYFKIGVTTIECKSGYGLDYDNEIKLLKVYQKLDEEHPVRLVKTLLAAHVVPLEYKNNRAEYIDLICDKLIPVVCQENLAEFCDIFVEDTAFQIDEAQKIFNAAKKLGLKPKLHADQLTNGGGASLAADVCAVSADHLEYISEENIEKMAEKNVVAVSLPIATLYLQGGNLKKVHVFPARKLINAGVPVAIATDFNPGSAPSYHLPFAMMLGCTLQRMTPSEVLKAVTIYAAKAVDRDKYIGSLENDKHADFAIIDAPDIDYWMYHFTPNACLRTFIDGVDTIPGGPIIGRI
jgi:imidazolonepropionase